MTDWAVFTGDIVKSTKLAPEALAAIFDGLHAADETLSAWQDAPARLTRFRGDGWQMVIRPALTFRALLTVRAAVRRAGKGFDTRIGVGIGPGEVAGDDLSGASGPAFVAAGRALDEMRRSTRMAAPEGPRDLQLCLPLADEILGGWTARQAEIAFLLLDPREPTQAQAAEALGLTQQTVQQQMDRSGLAGLLETCALMERP